MQRVNNPEMSPDEDDSLFPAVLAASGDLADGNAGGSPGIGAGGADEDGEPGVLSYEQARSLAAARPEVRSRLAARPDAPPEILYFLATDEREDVRRAVAANPSAPARASLLLADDPDSEIRAVLAARIAATPAPEAGRSSGPRARSLTREALDRLSRDNVTGVRAAIADGLKNLPDADPAIIGRLARDLEILVAAPILECSPVLSEDDLLEIIISSPIDGALAAISRRAYVEPRVTEAIVASGEPRAITHLLYNANAQLQEHTLDALIAAAEGQPEWHPPLVHRPELVAHGVERLAGILADHLLQRLVERQDLTADAARTVGEIISQRLRQREGDQQARRRLSAPYDTRTASHFAPFVEQARQAEARGELNETALIVAMLTDSVDEVVAGLSVLAGQPVTVVLEVLASQVPRAICALAWAARLSAHFACELQGKLGRISVENQIAPDSNGGYVLPEVELRWQMEMYADR